MIKFLRLLTVLCLGIFPISKTYTLENLDLGIQIDQKYEDLFNRFKDSSVPDILDQLSKDGIKIVARNEIIDPYLYPQLTDIVPSIYIDEEASNKLSKIYGKRKDPVNASTFGPGLTKNSVQHPFGTKILIWIASRMSKLIILHEYMHAIFRYQTSNGLGYIERDGKIYETRYDQFWRPYNDLYENYIKSFQQWQTDTEDPTKYEQLLEDELLFSAFDLHFIFEKMREEIFICNYTLEALRRWNQWTRYNVMETISVVGQHLNNINSAINRFESHYLEALEYINNTEKPVNKEFKEWFSQYSFPDYVQELKSTYHYDEMLRLKKSLEDM